MAFKMTGFSGFKENETGKATGTAGDNQLPKGFYEKFKQTANKNKTGQDLNMGATKAASIKNGKFTPVYV